MLIPDLAQFFPGGATQAEMRVVRKSGKPLFLLPPDAHVASRTLALYPAQTTAARYIRAVLRVALRLRLPLPLERIEIAFEPVDGFARFLSGLAGTATPRFGALLGNPNAPGRCLIFLACDDRGVPCAVVKAGATPLARDRVRAEAAFLRALPPGTKAAPAVRATFSNEVVEAVAFDFAPGHSPRGEDSRIIGDILRSWLTDRTLQLTESPLWQAVRAVSPSPLVTAVESAIVAHPFRSAIFHGDFCPWNVKAYRGGWTVLDWERGEQSGVPGWDWLHFVIQRAVLVQKLDAPAVWRRIETLLGSEEFRRYAAEAGIAPIVRPLVKGYLLFATDVLRPTEGAGTLAALRELSVAW